MTPTFASEGYGRYRNMTPRALSHPTRRINAPGDGLRRVDVSGRADARSGERCDTPRSVDQKEINAMAQRELRHPRGVGASNGRADT